MSMKEATLVEWPVKEGDFVNQGDIVLIIETEKTTWEVEALASGYVHILVGVEAVEPVGQAVGQIAETEEELKKLQAETGIIDTAAAAPREAATKAAPPKAPAKTGERVKASPVAKKLAEEHGLDLGAVPGTGPGGRITKEDVLKAVEAQKAAPPEAAPAEAGEFEGRRVKAALPLRTGMRKAIAAHMQRSLSVAAQLTTMGEIDMTEVKKLRSELLKQEETLQTRITYTDIFIKAVTRALQDHPVINSSLIENQIIIWEDINIGVAVALESDDYLGGGLIVPVIKHTDKKSIAEISRELKELVAKARAGKLLPDEVTGGTFTITNLGGAGTGYGFGTPIINQPESAILAPGAITDRPVVRDNEIVIRPVMTYSLTFDHRVIDGAPAAAFMARLTALLENPVLMIV